MGLFDDTNRRRSRFSRDDAIDAARKLGIELRDAACDDLKRRANRYLDMLGRKVDEHDAKKLMEIVYRGIDRDTTILEKYTTAAIKLLEKANIGLEGYAYDGLAQGDFDDLVEKLNTEFLWFAYNDIRDNRDRGRDRERGRGGYGRDRDRDGWNRSRGRDREMARNSSSLVDSFASTTDDETSYRRSGSSGLFDNTERSSENRPPRRRDREESEFTETSSTPQEKPVKNHNQFTAPSLTETKVTPNEGKLASIDKVFTTKHHVTAPETDATLPVDSYIGYLSGTYSSSALAREALCSALATKTFMAPDISEVVVSADYRKVEQVAVSRSDIEKACTSIRALSTTAASSLDAVSEVLKNQFTHQTYTILSSLLARCASDRIAQRIRNQHHIVANQLPDTIEDLVTIRNMRETPKELVDLPGIKEAISDCISRTVRELFFTEGAWITSESEEFRRTLLLDPGIYLGDIDKSALIGMSDEDWKTVGAAVDETQSFVGFDRRIVVTNTVTVADVAHYDLSLTSPRSQHTTTLFAILYAMQSLHTTTRPTDFYSMENLLLKGSLIGPTRKLVVPLNSENEGVPPMLHLVSI